MLDIAIIGAGPAGLSAAINAAQRNKKVKVFGRPISTSYLYKAENVDNHLGMPNLSGKKMMEDFLNHCLQKGIEVKQGRVLQILSMGDYYTLNFENEFIDAKTVIIATGLSKSQTIAGEENLVGKGVSYCATCDGMLYRNKKVAVVCETQEGLEDVHFLSEICEKVYFLPAFNIAESEKLSENVEIVTEKAISVMGTDKVEALQAGERQIVCEGVFFIKETTPVKNIVYGLEMDKNSIKVNRFMETNLPLVFAAGDCTGRPFQVSKAVGEGLIAAQQAVLTISKKQ